MEARVKESTLTDGSKVYDVQLLDGEDFLINIPCESKIAALTLLNAMLEHSTDVLLAGEGK